MLATHAGRLSFERTGDGINIEIPAHLSAKSELHSLLLGLISLFVVGGDAARWILCARQVSSPGWYLVTTHLLALFIIFWALWTILTSTRLVLSAKLLVIEYRVFGICWLSRRCPTSLLHNPRFHQKSSGIPSFLSGPPELRIERDYRTVVLAIGLNQGEGDALIAKMMEVYPFPKYLPNESAA